MNRSVFKSTVSFALVLFLMLCIPLSANAAPKTSAKSAILMEAESGRVLYQQNAFVRLPMASTTKIMTAIVAIEAGNIGRTVLVSPEAVGVEGSSIYLYPHEKLTLEQLLYALMLESANDAATAIAIEVAGSVEAFSALMNQKAEALGLTATHFTNPHGLDHEEHYTTAYDLAKIAAYAMKNDTFRKICGTGRITIPLKETEGTRVLINHNKLLSRYRGAVGVKTGFTKKSGRCLVSAAERDGMTLIAVTLHAPNDWNDHQSLLDFGFSHYKRETFAEKGDYQCYLPVIGGHEAQVTAVNSETLSALLSADHKDVTFRIEAPRMLYAPVPDGTVVGRVIVSCDGKDIAASDLITTHEISYKKAEKQSFFSWLKAFFFRER